MIVAVVLTLRGLARLMRWLDEERWADGFELLAYVTQAYLA